MATVTGQERAREDNEQCPKNGQPEHEEPWRRHAYPSEAGSSCHNQSSSPSVGPGKGPRPAPPGSR